MQKFNQSVSIKNVILKYFFETPRELKYTRCDIKNLKTFAIQVFYRDSTFLEVWIFGVSIYESWFLRYPFSGSCSWVHVWGCADNKISEEIMMDLFW